MDSKEYFAFISYQRKDEEWAKWLAHELEHYRFPVTLNGRKDLPKELRPIFRDIDELSAGNLPNQIHKALEDSKHLIVVCSPNSAKSEWVNKEIEEFISMGKIDKIFPFIVEGKAFSEDSNEECFPPALRNLPKEEERLGGNIAEMGRDAAVVKTVAGMLDLAFDTLWQRYEREKAEEEMRKKEERDNLLRLQSRYVAEKCYDLVKKDDSYSAQFYALAVLPDNLINPNRPYTIEAETALRKANTHQGAILARHTYAVNSVDFSPDGRKIVSASDDCTIKIWDAESGVLLQTLEENTSEVRSATFSPDGKKIVSVLYKWWETIKIWDAENSALLQTLEGDTDEVNSALFSPDGKKIVSVSGENIMIWDADTGIMNYYYLQGHTDDVNSDVNSIVFSPDGRKIVSASDDETIKIWDAENGVLLQTLEGHTDAVNSAVFSPDGRKIVSASLDCTIKIWKVESDVLIQTLKKHSEIVNSAEFSPDGRKIVSASDDRTIKIWDAESGVLLQTLEGHTRRVNSAAFSSDGRKIVSASDDETIKIWNAESGILLQTFEGHTRRVNSAAFNPNGRKIVSASWDRTIKLWDAESGVILQTLEGHTNPVNSAVFSPDGRKIVSASDDETIKIWDAESGILLQTFEGHTRRVNSAAFSFDGRKIVSASYDDTIKIWNFRPLQELIDETRRRFKNRKLTPEECSAYYLVNP